MNDGGGFCERHGPFDRPHTTCPYCAMESNERNAYGPPEGTVPSAPAGDAHEPVDITSEPDVTNPLPRDAQDVPDDEFLDAADYVPDDPGLSGGARADHDGDSGFVLATYEPEPHAVPQPMRSQANLTEIAPRSDMLPEHWEEEADADAERELLAWLIVKQPLRRRGAILSIRANQSIGREGDIRWDDPRLSRQHAKFTVEPPDDADPDSDVVPLFHVWPFGPTNPVHVNGKAIRGATPLQENDEITLGNTLFVVKLLLD